jgi:malonate decarboxylase gamma subunit
MTDNSRESIEKFLRSLFGEKYAVRFDDLLLSGEGTFDGTPVAILGTSSRAPIGVSLALSLSRHVLDIMREHPKRSILLIVENSGQKIGLFDELMGNNGYVAHLSTCLDAARRRGHKIIGVVHDLAISAGFMATGMAASECYALNGAELRVMAPEAMSRIMRIPLERLNQLSKTNAILGPGAVNFERIGGIAGIWSDDVRGEFRKALSQPDEEDARRETGVQRGGRLFAARVARAVRAGRRQL